MVIYADTPMSSNFDGCTCVRTVDDKWGRRKKTLANKQWRWIHCLRIEEGKKVKAERNYYSRIYLD